MGMDNNSIMSYVQHYQRNIERAQDNEQKLIYCIGKLYKLPITVEHLQETGIGKTVNALRKFDGEIGISAKALVIKWKAMVAAEEVPKEEDESYETEASLRASTQEANELSREQSPKEQLAATTASTSHREHRPEQQHHTNDTSTKHKTHQSRHEQHKTKDKIENHGRKEVADRSHKSSQRDKHHEGRSERKERERHDKQDTDKRRDRSEKTDKEHKKPKEQRDHREHKQDKEQQQQQQQQSTKSTSQKDKNDSRKEKKQHSSDTTKKHRDKESKKEKETPSQNIEQKTSKHNNSRELTRKRMHEQDEEYLAQKKSKATNETSIVNDVDVQDDGIDSSMGANFADVLGMLNMPGSSRKSNKKSTSSPQKATSSQRTDVASTSRFCNGFKSTLSVAALEKKPALLSSTVKLEPLDPNIALELPTISNNYRPMPLNQTVMDCVFNTNSSSATKSSGRMLSDAEALAHSISSKTMRTKIYSGARSGQVYQVPTLFDLCIRMLQKNIDALEYTGGVPFEVLKPVLDRCTPQQLYVFEEYNPYIMEDTDILWKLHVQRKYRVAKRQEMESWREMYLRCQEDEERKLNRLTETIKQKEKIIAAPVRKIQLAFVDTTVKPPRNVARKQEQFGTSSKLIATPAARVAALSNVTPNAARPGDVRLRVAASVRDTAQVSHAPVRAKKAPLMAKTLQFMRGRLKR